MDKINLLSDEGYKKYENLINKMAWSAALATGLEYDELKSRGNLIFCEAVNTWDPAKGAFSTHLSWKLLTLKHAIAERYAPNSATGVETMWVSLEQAAIGKDGEELSSDPVEASEQYSQKMNETTDSCEWEQRIPDFRQYMDAMDSDTKKLCTDILDGQFDSDAMKEVMSRKNYIKYMSNISVMRYYKRYIQIGWTKQRTQRALDNLRQMCRCWMHDRLPCRLNKITDISIPELF